MIIRHFFCPYSRPKLPVPSQITIPSMPFYIHSRRHLRSILSIPLSPFHHRRPSPLCRHLPNTSSVAATSPCPPSSPFSLRSSEDCASDPACGLVTGRLPTTDHYFSIEGRGRVDIDIIAWEAFFFLKRVSPPTQTPPFPDAVVMQLRKEFCLYCVSGMIVKASTGKWSKRKIKK